MCGIFLGINSNINEDKFSNLKLISKYSQSRGKEASGLMFMTSNNQQKNFHSNDEITNLIKKNEDPIKKIMKNFSFYIGHTRIVTHGVELEEDNQQPVKFNETCIVHNGICVNYKEIWQELNLDGEVKLDSRSIAALIDQNIENNFFDILSNKVSGETSVIGYNEKINQLFAYTNTGSIYYSFENSKIGYLASEKYTLSQFYDSENIIKIEPNTGITFTADGELIQQYETKKNRKIVHSVSIPKN